MKRMIIQGTAGAFVIRVAAAFAGFLMNVALARMLTLSDYGVVALGLSWLTIAGTIACFGTDTVALRFVAEGLAKNDAAQVAAVVRWGGRLSVVLGVLCAAASIGLLLVLFRDYSAEQRWALGLIVAATPLLAFTLNRASALRGTKRVVLGVTVEMLLRPLGVLVLAVVVSLQLGWQLGVLGAALTVVLAQALPALIGAIASRRFAIHNGSPETVGRSAEWLRIAVPIASVNVMGVLIGNVDTILIGYFVDAENAGVYRASTQLTALVTLGLAASNGIVAPVIAELFSSGRLDELRRVLRFSVALVSVGSVVGALTIALFGTALLGLFGTEYQAGYPILLILLIGQVVNALCGPTGFMMSMTGQQQEAMKIFAISSAVNIALNLLLIPLLGLIGGAIANVVGMVLWNVSILAFLRGRLRLDPSLLSWVSSASEVRAKRTVGQNA